MGFGTPHSAARRQLRYFGRLNASRYSCLVLDNRGIGRSDKPSCRYTTSEMARDVADLLVHVGWLDAGLKLPTDEPSPTLNISGSSMGGMIAQELAMILPPNTVNTLTLASTFPRFVRTKGFFKTLVEQVHMLFPPGDIDAQMNDFCAGLFSQQYLEQPDTEADEAPTGGPEGGNFPTVRDRICAGELRQREDRDGFGLKGLMLQMGAAAVHHKNRQQLQEMLSRVGRGRIAVCHGTADEAIGLHHGELLRDDFGEGVEFKVWDGAGHVLFWEREAEFNSWLQERIDKAEKLSS